MRESRGAGRGEEATHSPASGFQPDYRGREGRETLQIQDSDFYVLDWGFKNYSDEIVLLTK